MTVAVQSDAVVRVQGQPLALETTIPCIRREGVMSSKISDGVNHMRADSLRPLCWPVPRRGLEAYSEGGGQEL